MRYTFYWDTLYFVVSHYLSLYPSHFADTSWPVACSLWEVTHVLAAQVDQLATNLILLILTIHTISSEVTEVTWPGVAGLGPVAVIKILRTLDQKLDKSNWQCKPMKTGQLKGIMVQSVPFWLTWTVLCLTLYICSPCAHYIVEEDPKQTPDNLSARTVNITILVTHWV